MSKTHEIIYVPFISHEIIDVPFISRLFHGHNVDMLDMGTYENCEKGCKVKKPAPDTQAGTGGTTSDYRSTTDSYVIEYRLCNNNICPVAEGEIIVKNCTCINEFAEATSIMQVLGNAGKDIICSGQ